MTQGDAAVEYSQAVHSARLQRAREYAERVRKYKPTSKEAEFSMWAEERKELGEAVARITQSLEKDLERRAKAIRFLKTATETELSIQF